MDFMDDSLHSLHMAIFMNVVNNYYLDIEASNPLSPWTHIDYGDLHLNVPSGYNKCSDLGA